MRGAGEEQEDVAGIDQERVLSWKEAGGWCDDKFDFFEKLFLISFLNCGNQTDVWVKQTKTNEF